MNDDPETLRTRLQAAAWERHANPWSGWSRVLTLPLLLYGIYARRLRVVASVRRSVWVAIPPTYVASYIKFLSREHTLAQAESTAPHLGIEPPKSPRRPRRESGFPSLHLFSPDRTRKRESDRALYRCAFGSAGNNHTIPNARR